MTTHYSCLECNVTFEKNDADAVVAAVNKATNSEHTTLEDAFGECGFRLNDDGEVYSLEPSNGYVYDVWDALFPAIAPHVAPESMFCVYDEHGTFSGWRVRNGEARCVTAVITWEDAE